MREIKFRAWDSDEKRYLKPIDTTSMVLRFLSGRVTDGAMNCPHIILQQYTGLKDKNGTMIFEGDIVRFGHKSQAIYSAVENCNIAYNNNIGTVVFRECNFVITDESQTDNYWLGSKQLFGIEVIGNIYQKTRSRYNDTRRME